MAAWTQMRWRGYADIGGASLILGTSGALLQLATLPVTLLLVLRTRLCAGRGEAAA